MCYHGEVGHSALKGIAITTGEPPKFGSLELHCLGIGGVDYLKYTPLPLPHQIWYFCDRQCTHK